MTASRDQGAAPRQAPARRIGRWLARLILALLLIVCITLVAVFSFEQYSLRPLAELVVERATGRAFAIDGDLDARAGRIVSIRAGGIRLGNADWGSNDDLLSIDEAEISIDLFNLLDRGVAIDEVVVTGVKLIFEEDEQGRSNWAMGSDDAPSASSSEGQGTMALPIVHSQLTDIDITVINAALARPLEIRLDSVGHSVDQGNEMRTTVVGAIDNRPLNLQASIGPLAQLLDAGAVDFDIKADFEAIALEVNGHLDTLLAPQQVSVHVSMVSAELSKIFTTFGLPEITSGATEIKASMLPSGDHHSLDIAVSSDNLKLDAEARLRALNTIDGTSLTVTAEGPDLAAIAKLAGLNGLPSQPFNFESSVALAGKQLTIGETKFNTGDGHLTAKGTISQFPKLVGTNLQLHLVGKNYLEYAELLGITGVAELQPESFEVHTNLEYSAQGEQLFTTRIKLADVSGELSGRLTGYPTFVGSHLDYRLDGQGGALIQRLLGRPTLIVDAYKLQGKLKRIRSGFGVESTALSFGANELEVSGVIGKDPLRSDTELSMRFHGPDLEKIAAIAGYTGFLPAGKAEINAAAWAQDNGIHVDELTARLDRNTLKASGLINLPAGVAGSRVKVALVGVDIADVLPPDLLSYVDPQQPFKLTGTLATDTDQITINAMQASLGKVTLEASGTVSTQQPLTDMSLKVDARGPDLAAIIPQQLVPYSLPAEKFSVAGGVALTENGLRLDGVNAMIGADRLGLSGTIPLDTPSDGLNLSVTASGPNLGGVVPLQLGQLDFTELAYEIGGNIQLAQGRMSLRQLNFSTPRGRLSGQLSVSLENPRQFGQFDLEASGDNLAEFSPAMPNYTPAAVPFDLNAHGSWDSKKVSIETGTLQLNDASIEVQGEVDLPPDMTATRLELSAHGDQLSDLGQIKGLILPPVEFRIDASLQGDANSLQIPEVNARIGESDLRGSLQVGFAEKPEIKIKLESDFLDLAKLVPPEDKSLEVEAPTQPETGDGRLIPQLAVPVEQLHRINLETRIRLSDLQLPNRRFQNVEIDLNLQDGNLTVSQFQATATKGQIIARFQANADGDRIVTSGRLEGKELVLGNMDESAEGPIFPKLNLELEFETAGATVRELAANLNSYALFTGGEGRLENSRALGLYGGFATELLSSVNPFVTREPYTRISCFTAFTEIVDGVAQIDPGTVMQTDKLDMFAGGSIDLNTEQIRLRFDTAARKGIGISAGNFINPFVGVSGTLASPGLGVDPKSATFEGGFAVATGGLSIVAKGLFSRWLGNKDPCVELETNAKKYLQEKQGAEQEKSVADDQ
ncbi:MAG: AsmA family protein [Gammaproteobacteria bacterium]|nr:AsmA family protein [Gammaproteobacteria bacterium]